MAVLAVKENGHGSFAVTVPCLKMEILFCHTTHILSADNLKKEAQ